MANKLSPPIISDTLPAFYKKEGVDECVITVPFRMNSIVGAYDISGIAYQIKHVQTGRILYSGSVDFNITNQGGQDSYSISISITQPNNKLIVGKFYKIQIAYINKDTIPMIGFYSKAGIAKYTTQPVCQILNFENVNSNVLLHQRHYIGIYQNKNDISEKLYSYRFQLLEVKNEKVIIVDDSQDIIYYNNSSQDQHENNEGEVSVGYDCYYSLDPSKRYIIKFSVKSIHNLTAEVSYEVKEVNLNWKWFDGILVAVNDPSKGYVSVFINNNYTNLSSREAKLLNGTFILSRASSADNYATWYDLRTYSWAERYTTNSIPLFYDYTVEQGLYYIYALQLINEKSPNKFRTERIKSEPVYVDFEDCFLFDGEQSLKLKFNTKISSFKTTLLEQKMDTIGSKFPIFMRNESVAYKEFPISGLISYHMDDDNTFLHDANIGLDKDTRTWKDDGRQVKEDEEEPYVRTTNLVDYNIAAERRFKLKVLDWLNNGKPKLFRSPTEGNYLVRLMNTSLTPEETLGRMLHNFSTTAYEIDEHDPLTLTKYGIIRPDVVIKHSYLVGETITVMPQDLYRYRNKNKYQRYYKSKNFFEGKEIIGFDVDSTLSYLNLEITQKIGDKFETTNIDMTDQHYAIQPNEGFTFTNLRVDYYHSHIWDDEKRAKNSGYNRNNINDKNALLGNIFSDPIATATGPVITITYYYWQTPLESWFTSIYDIVFQQQIGEQYIGEHQIEKEILKNYFVFPNHIIAIGARYRPFITVTSQNKTKNEKEKEIESFIKTYISKEIDMRYFLIYPNLKELKLKKDENKNLKLTSNEDKELTKIKDYEKAHKILWECLFKECYPTKEVEESEYNLLSQCMNFLTKIKRDTNLYCFLIEDIISKDSLILDTLFPIPSSENFPSLIKTKMGQIKKNIKTSLTLIQNIINNVENQYGKIYIEDDEKVFIYNPQDPTHLYLPEKIYFSLLRLTLNNDNDYEKISPYWQTYAINDVFKCYDNTFCLAKKEIHNKEITITPWITPAYENEEVFNQSSPSVYNGYYAHGFTYGIDDVNNQDQTFPAYELYPNELEQANRSFQGIKNLEYLRAINKHYIIYQGSPMLDVNDLYLHSSMGIVVDISYDCTKILFNLKEMFKDSKEQYRAEMLFTTISQYFAQLQRKPFRLYQYLSKDFYNFAEEESIELEPTNDEAIDKETKINENLWYKNKNYGLRDKIQEYGDLIQQYVESHNMIDVNNKLWSQILLRGRGQ